MKCAYLRVAPEFIGDAKLFAVLSAAGVRIVGSGRSDVFSDDVRLLVEFGGLPDACERALLDVAATVAAGPDGQAAYLKGFHVVGAAQESPEYQISRLRLLPDDVIVVQLAGSPITSDHADRIKAHVSDAVGDGHKVLVLDGSARIEVLGEKAA